METSSTPSISQFDPCLIPFQKTVIQDVRKTFDYKSGIHEILFSGSVGSSKSLLLAHLLVTHCLLYPKARALMGRLTLQDLKDTLIQKVIEHIGDDLKEGRDFEYNRSAQKFTFSNGSELISRSWHDKDFKKFRSLELSAAGVEEAVESDEEYKMFYFELVQRVGRLPHVPEAWIALATNPDSDSHWLYKHFFVEKHANRHVYLSRTLDNPFLPKSYVDKLREILDPKQALRMLEGIWCEIDDERVYHSYKRENNFRDYDYELHPAYPIDISHDFNIGGPNKPMSANVAQLINDQIHVAKTFAVEGARTYDILEEMAADGIFEHPNSFRIFGDATGAARTTTSIKSNYDQIREFLSNYRRKDNSSLNFEILVPRSNPPIRERHNLMNAAFLNAAGQSNCFLYKGASILDEGFRLTKLKKGGNYIEDDNLKQQHATTALGYYWYYIKRLYREKRQAYRLM